MEIRPLGSSVVLELVNRDNVSDSGIVLDKKSGYEDYSLVLAIGPDAEKKGFIVGDKVITNHDKVFRYSMDGKEIIVVDVYSIIGVLES